MLWMQTPGPNGSRISQISQITPLVIDIERLKGIKFSRPRMPVDAINSKMRLWVMVDAAKELLVIFVFS